MAVASLELALQSLENLFAFNDNIISYVFFNVKVWELYNYVGGNFPYSS